VSSIGDAPSDDEDSAPPPIAPDAATIPAPNVPAAAPHARRKRRTEAELLGPAVELGTRDRRPRDLATRSAIPLVERDVDRAPAAAPEPEDLEDLERSFSGLNIDEADGPELDTAAFVHVDIPPELNTDLSDAVISEVAYALAAAAAAGEVEADPRTLREAEQSSKWPAWQAAIKKEHNALFDMGTFGETVHRLPPGRKAIDSKLVFKTKYMADSSIEREKVRLVANGFSQVPGLDFDETFAPVVKLTSLCILCAMAVWHWLFFDILNVETAYLHGHLEEELYIRLLKGFGPDGDEIKRLVCSIYGLKQSGRVWNELLHEVLTALGYTHLDSEHGLYLWQEGSRYCIIATYVDDMPHLGTDRKVMDEHQERLNRAFKLKKLQVSQLLGMGIAYVRQGQTLVLSQEQYIHEIAAQYGMSDAKFSPTLLSSAVQLTKADCPATNEERNAMAGVPYASLLGSLMFAMLATRPNIAYAIGSLSKFSSNPGLVHWRELKRVVRYLLGTIDLVLVFRGNTRGGELRSQLLHGYTNSDWAGELDKHRSTSGYTFLMAGAAISWSSKLQSTPALLSTEAEYVAGTRATQEALWLCALLGELGFIQLTPTRLLCNNQGALALARNPVNHPRTRHIELRFHMIRKAVSRKLVTLEYCLTEDMTADIFTKGLGSIKHYKFIRMLGMESRSSGSVRIATDPLE
jgi:hypothetical protein